MPVSDLHQIPVPTEMHQPLKIVQLSLRNLTSLRQINPRQADYRCHSNFGRDFAEKRMQGTG